MRFSKRFRNIRCNRAISSFESDDGRTGDSTGHDSFSISRAIELLFGIYSKIKLDGSCMELGPLFDHEIIHSAVRVDA